ncbi:MAG TPA: serine acetyltransferase [Thauera sp.]|uniref:serine O-acetyltransferase EpsC n=1 Tax=Thauera sp. TaxID=1905334 RepID=UPI002BA9349C|nr:serine O-acetyltransferase EpsC [Thauera sp.]HRP24416.1 serine acetyltransferase [Thauera sp.]HRP66536.1 serine acetyltransferase [Thauera sp.]
MRLPGHPHVSVIAPAACAEGGWDLERIVVELRQARERWREAQQRKREFGVREFPSRDALQEIASALCSGLFPMRLGPTDLCQEGEDFYVGHTLHSALNALLHQVRLELAYQARHDHGEARSIVARAESIVHRFAADLPRLRVLLDTDVQAAFDGDPAARSVDEVLLCYPGVLAIIHHRLAHTLYRLGAPLVARILSEIAHSQTGIDIHPGAQIGAAFFIDHGTGVVIGETAVIGERVRLYQAVTLGARSFASEADGTLSKGGARHPVLEDDVVIYAGATVLGRITIGRGSSIGGNVWLTRSVPPGSHVTQAGLQHGQVEGKVATT